MHNWYYYSNYNYSPFSGLGLFLFIIHVLFWGLVIILAIKLIKSLFGRSESYSDENETVQKIIKRRYAEGEITKKEFEQLKKDLA